MFATWMADALRGAGILVTEMPGWKTRGHYGGFVSLDALTWHHDASARGDSPGVPAYMLGNWDVAGAGLWVNRYGVWTLISAGPSYHAGKVLPGMPGNRNSQGIETDHTTGEDWPPALLNSLRLGTAVLLDNMQRNPANALHFHKTICDPPGRKSDPDGLDLATERAAVALIRKGGSSRPPQLGDRELGVGDTGADVSQLQALLHVRDDGIFGRETESVVKGFQASSGLEADGIVGKNTLSALNYVNQLAHTPTISSVADPIVNPDYSEGPMPLLVTVNDDPNTPLVNEGAQYVVNDTLTEKQHIANEDASRALAALRRPDGSPFYTPVVLPEKQLLKAKLVDVSQAS